MASVEVYELTPGEAARCVAAIVDANPLLLPETPADFAALVELRRAYDVACVDYAQRHGLVAGMGYVLVAGTTLSGAARDIVPAAAVWGVWGAWDE